MFSSNKKMVIDLYLKWKQDRAARLGSALSFYAILALPFLLITLISLLAVVLGEENTRQQLLNQVSVFIAPAVAEAVQNILFKLPTPELGTLAGFTSIIIFFFIANTIFVHLKHALHDIWYIPRAKQKTFKKTIGNRLLSSAILFMGGALFLTSILLEAILSLLQTFLAHYSELSLSIFQTTGFIMSSILIFIFFSLLFFLLPETSLRYRDALIGGIFTGILFIIGKTGMEVYLSNSNLISFYGAAGSVILIILWIYYSAQIFFIGAEFIYLYSQAQGRPILSKKAGFKEKWKKRSKFF